MSMDFVFKKAERRNAKARLALAGPSGSGKTFTALQFANVLSPGSIAVIDTEHGSASKYDHVDFQVLDFPRSPTLEMFVKGIGAARDAGFETLIIDSFSHAWEAILDEVDRITQRSKSKNAFSTGWRDIKPEEKSVLEALLYYPGHVIVTLRSKMEYIIEENSRGQKVPRKLGMAPIQRSGIEYEFDLVGEIDIDHTLVFTKSRVTALADGVYKKPGPDVAEVYKKWLDGGKSSHAIEVAKVQSVDDLKRFAKDNASSISSLSEIEKGELWSAVKPVCKRLGVEPIDFSKWVSEAKSE